MSFTFKTVPSDLLVPGVYPQVQVIESNLAPINDQVLIVAQKATTGIAEDGAVIPVFDVADANLQFGSGSPAALSVSAAFTANPSANLSVLGMDCPGAPATATITVISAAEAYGNTFNFVLDDTVIPFNFSTPYGYSESDVADALANQINAVAGLPVNANSSGPTVILTANANGVWGNDLNLGIIYPSSDNTSITITTSFADATTGVGLPVLGDYQEAGTYAHTLATCHHTVLVNTLGDALSCGIISDIASYRSSPIEQNYCIQILGATDIQEADASHVAAFATGLDDARTSIAYIKYTNGNIPKSSAMKIAAAYGATIPVSSNTSVNVPYDGLTLAGICTPSVVDQFTSNEENYLLQNGVTPLAVVPGGDVIIVRAVSTDTLNKSGATDLSLLDINTIRTIDYVSTEIVDGVQNNFQRATLSPRVLKSIVSNIFNTTVQLENAGILQNAGFYKNAIIAQPDAVNLGQIDVTVPVQIVVGLHVVTLNIQVNL